MSYDENTLRFFLGANSPQGFVSRFDQLADVGEGWRIMVIKGGPGTGKSTLMRKVADALKDSEPDMQYIPCTADSNSLDAVIAPNMRFSIADGTSPHVIEPKYPGVFETLVDTGCWDESLLHPCREEIIAISKSYSDCHQHSCRFLSAAGSLIGDTYRIALDCVDTEKLSRYSARLADRELKSKPGKVGSEKVRFFSAVTCDGVVFYEKTADILCKKIYLIDDEYGAVGRLLLNSLRARAIAAGYDIISCYCPLSPFEKLEHMFIPELSLGFVTSNRFHDMSESKIIEPYRIVNSQRFISRDKIAPSRRRLLFNRKAAAKMLDRASQMLQDAKKLHGELESYYVQAMDFEKLDELTQYVMDKIQKFREL